MKSIRTWPRPLRDRDCSTSLNDSDLFKHRRPTWTLMAATQFRAIVGSEVTMSCIYLMYEGKHGAGTSIIALRASRTGST